MSPSAHTALRARTAAAHEAIDGAFARFSLAERESYRHFLLAHARVLFTLEAMLEGQAGLPLWRSRRAALDADLRDLGAVRPEPLPVEPIAGEAALHGVLYVLEGSRLGGRLLSRQVGEGLPSAFLSAAHEKGEWREFLSRLDARAQAEGPLWLDAAVDGASCAFGLYGRAAEAG
ncbi:MAG: biliverdin-producing heme oxygenase [Methylobacterium mesophilicum]|nr:biliverdin-producing heme oxygenase [Methylobacterium mesophilicum]